MYINGSEVIQRITCNVPHDAIFKFSSTTVKEVVGLLNKTDPAKATGYDDIPPKSLKMGATELAPTITNLINQSKTIFFNHIPNNPSANDIHIYVYDIYIAIFYNIF